MVTHPPQRVREGDIPTAHAPHLSAAHLSKALLSAATLAWSLMGQTLCSTPSDATKRVSGSSAPTTSATMPSTTSCRLYMMCTGPTLAFCKDKDGWGALDKLGAWMPSRSPVVALSLGLAVQPGRR
jgi:hypothetical protein